MMQSKVPSKKVFVTTTFSDIGHNPIRSSSHENAPSTPQEPTRYRHKLYTPGAVDIFFLGITIVLSGQYMSWNIGLIAGVYTFTIVYVLVGLAYVTFCCCMSELTSALPFAGGSYGLARCTLGFFPAFLIGCAEALEYTMCAAIQTLCVSDIIIKAVPSLDQYRVLVWIAIYYIPTITVQCIGGAVFWLISTSLGVFQLVLLLVYCFGLLGEVDVRENVLADPTALYAGGFHSAMHVLPIAAWFFIGVEALNLASDDVPTPKTQIPRGQVSCVVVLFITGLFTLLVTVSIPAEGGIGRMSRELFVLNNGFMRLFDVSASGATLLALPSQYSGAMGFTWAAADLISSMGKSKLLPPWLGTTSFRFGTPYCAVLVVSAISLVVCFIVYSNPAIAEYLLPMCLLVAFISYSGQCVGYILIRVRGTIRHKRNFRNPFGLVGAVYCLAVWIIGIVAIAGFHGHDGVEFLVFLVAAGLLGVYYKLAAQKRQTLSEEESKVFLVAHIAFFNKRRRPDSYVVSTMGSSSNRVSSRTRPKESHARSPNR